ncbi:SDR family oxidoreductase [Flavihumibacter rivuli]|uniref:SDR family oxidoreductase n=1 Tax=Flavihumibacter rivuli TaxID=2838156 RepID=UPI001BDF4EF0|nr:SDR family oxidoreductase [Flavihumibacter rivuli]ULQ55606.1 SDR family oxidoreductase [Flavihumibacter rivuli]
MSLIANSTVLITGGASGIGKGMAISCLEKGASNVIIWDIDEAGMEKLAVEMAQQGKRIHTDKVDVSSVDSIQSAAARAREQFGGIDILINNAGVIIGKPFHEHTHRDIDFTMSINTDALMHIALEFVPGMIRNRRGHVVNIASAAGMSPNLRMSIYVASKWAVIGWSESLRLELEGISPDLHVTTVTPFYINTGMFSGVQSPFIPIVEQDVAVRKIIKGIERNKIFVRMPGIVYALPLFRGILPQRWYDLIVGKWLGIYKSMDTFRGRN